MKLAIFHPGFGTVGGAELLAATQARYCAARGHAVKLVTLALDSLRWRDELAGVPITVIPRRRWTDLGMAWSRVAKLERRAARAAPEFEGCDLVLAHNYPCSAMLGMLDLSAHTAWQCNEPRRDLHVRDANPHLTARVEARGPREAGDWGEGFARMLRRSDRAAKAGRDRERTVDRASVARLDLVYAISEFSRGVARRIYQRCHDTVIPPMVRFTEPVARRHGCDRDGVQVLTHARLANPKNVGTVVRGFARFRAKTCPGARLHIVGEGPQRARLERLARALCPPETVRFHGYLTPAALREVYAACDVFALLPTDEPFGMVFAEAAAQGLLLVGPNHGGPLEILDGGRLGWACDPFSPADLADTLAAIWTLDATVVDRRRLAADRACRARYAPDVVGPALLDLLQGAGLT